MGKKLSKKQIAHRAYIKSKEWALVRERYWNSKLLKSCYVCGKSNKPMDLHHRTYDRFGNERLTDLVPVHRKCHRKIHRFHRSHPELTLWEATRKCKKT